MTEPDMKIFIRILLSVNYHLFKYAVENFFTETSAVDFSLHKQGFLIPTSIPKCLNFVIIQSESSLHSTSQ